MCVGRGRQCRQEKIDNILNYWVNALRTAEEQEPEVDEDASEAPAQ